MQRKEFENRIKSLLPKAADDVVESWAEDRAKKKRSV